MKKTLTSFLTRIVMLSLTLTGRLAAQAAPEVGALKIGWAQADITPEEPVILTGQTFARVSEGVAKPLTATVLVLESTPPDRPPSHVIMVSLDLLSVSECIRTGVREILRERLPEVTPEAITFNATHTHTAPYHYARPRYREADADTGGRHPYGVELPAISGADYVAFAAARVAAAVAEAWAAREPGGIAFGLGHAVVGYNRLMAYQSGRSAMYGRTNREDFSHIEGYEDHGLNILATYDADRELTGLVVNLACPAQSEESGYLVSADFFHNTRAELRRRFGDRLQMLPQVSAAGDQSPRPLATAAAERRMRRLADRNPEEEIATRIADGVERILPLLAKDINWNPMVAYRREILELPRRILAQEDVDQALAAAEPHRRRYQALLAELEANPDQRNERRWYVNITRAYRQSRRGESVRRRFEEQQRNPNLGVEVHAIRLGDAAFVTNPFELYVDYGMQIKARSPAVQTFVVQLAGPGSYLPTARSIAGGAYGAVPASTEIGVEGGAALVEWSVRTLTELMALE